MPELVVEEEVLVARALEEVPLAALAALALAGSGPRLRWLGCLAEYW